MKLLTLISVFLLPCWGLGQFGREAALTKGTALFRLLDPKIPDSELAAIRVEERGADPAEHQLHRWDVSTPYRTLSLSPDNGALLSYGNGHVDGRAHLGPESRGVSASGPPFFASNAALVAWVRAVLTKIEVPVRVRVEADPLPSPNSQGQVPRQIVTVMFFDRPNGFDTANLANLSSISLDSLDGEICSLMVISRYSYPPPVVNITREAARQIAAREFGIDLPLDQVSEPVYYGLDERAELSDLGRSLAKQKKAPLCYLASYSRVNEERHTEVHSCAISADTGEILEHFSGVLGDFVPGDSPAQSKPGHTPGSILGARERAEKSKRTQLAVLLSLAAIVGAIIVAGIMVRRRGLRNLNPGS